MATAPWLSGPFVESLAGLGPVDLVIGLATRGPAPAAPAVAAAARAGLAASLPEQRAAFVHVDETGSDEAVAAVAAALPDVPCVVARPPDIDTGPGRWRPPGTTVLLAVTDHLEPRAMVVLGFRTLGAATGWAPSLAIPVVKEGHSLVLAAYERGPLEGTLTQALPVPLVRALFGWRIQHPVAEEFACATETARRWLAAGILDVPPDLVDGWLVPAAIASGVAVAQARLGPRVLAPAESPEPLGTTVGRIASALFTAAVQFESSWLETRGSRAAPLLGEASGTAALGAAPDAERMLAGFAQGVRDLFPLWERILAPETLGEVLALGEGGAGRFHYPDRLWARTLYDFLLAWRFRVAPRMHIARSLTPLYLGRTASAVLEAAARPASAPGAAERLAAAVEAERSYLVERWQ